MNILVIVLLILLVLGFIGLFVPRIGRMLFDVAVFIILVFVLLGQLGQLT